MWEALKTTIKLAKSAFRKSSYNECSQRATWHAPRLQLGRNKNFRKVFADGEGGGSEILFFGGLGREVILWGYEGVVVGVM